MRHYTSTSSSCTPFDQVSIFTFPNIQANNASDDTSCPTSNPTIPYYSTPTAGAAWSAPTGTAATYQVTGYMSNYSANNKPNGGLNTSSALTIAAGGSGKSNCKGLQTPGGDGTYYAGAIYAAQSSLIAAQTANPGSLNAMIILSDGAANTTKMTNESTTATRIHRWTTNASRLSRLLNMLPITGRRFTPLPTEPPARAAPRSAPPIRPSRPVRLSRRWPPLRATFSLTQHPHRTRGSVLPRQTPT